MHRPILPEIIAIIASGLFRSIVTDFTEVRMGLLHIFTRIPEFPVFAGMPYFSESVLTDIPHGHPVAFTARHDIPGSDDPGKQPADITRHRHDRFLVINPGGHRAAIHSPDQSIHISDHDPSFAPGFGENQLLRIVMFTEFKKRIQ